MIHDYQYEQDSMKQKERRLDITASIPDVWFESSSIEWWWETRMNTWGLEGIEAIEAQITEIDSIRW